MPRVGDKDLARLESLLGVRAAGDPAARLDAVTERVAAVVRRANAAAPRAWCPGCPLVEPLPAEALDNPLVAMVASQWTLAWAAETCADARAAGVEGAGCHLLKLQRRLVVHCVCGDEKPARPAKGKK